MKQIKFLLVEDEEASRNYYKYLLEHSLKIQVEVMTAENGEEALGILKDNQIDCVLLDYNLPDIDGISLIKTIQETNNPPYIVFLTAAENRMLTAEAMKAGARDFIIKDVSKPYLFIETLKKVVNELTTFEKENKKFKLTVLHSCGTFVVLIGLLVLFGWIVHESILIQINASYTPMQVNTAVGLVASGFGMLTYVKFPRLTMILGSIVLLIGLLSLSEYVFSINLGIDQLIIKPYLVSNPQSPGRMAPNTALYLLLCGIIFCLRYSFFTWKHTHLYTFIISLFLIAMGMTAVVGYLMHVSIAYGWGHWAQMGINTALAITLIGIGFATFFWYHYRLYTLNKIVIYPMLIVIMGLLIFILLWQYLVKIEYNKIADETQTNAFVAQKLFQTNINNYYTAAVRMVQRLEKNEYKSDDIWKFDAINYLHDFPALAALIVKQQQTIEMSQSRLSNVIKLNICNSVGERVDNNTCWIFPYGSNKQLVLLVDISNIAMLSFAEIPELSNYNIELLQRSTALYDYRYKEIKNNKNWMVSLPITVNGIDQALIVWPKDAIVKSSQSWFPIISLLSGLLVTFLLAFVIRVLQKVKDNSIKFQSSEKKFRNLLNTTSDGMLVVNREGEVVLANQAAISLLGYLQDELLGIKVESLIPERFKKNHLVFRKTYMKYPVARVMGAAKNLFLLTKKREEIPVEISLNPIDFNDAKAILCSIHDMRQAQENQNRLRQQSHTIQVMLDITNAIANEEVFEKAMYHCITIICAAFQWQIGHVYLVDENNTEILLPSHIWYLGDVDKSRAFVNQTMETKISYGIDLPGRVLASGAPAWIKNVREETNFLRLNSAKQCGLHSGLAFPIKINAQIIGILEFFTTEERIEDQNIMVIITILSNQISRFLEYQNIQEQNKNLALRFKFAVGSGNIGVWEWNLKTNKLTWDEQMFKLYGIDAITFKGTYDDWKNALHPDDKAEAIATLEHAVKVNKPFDTEFRIIKPTGEVRYIEAKATLLFSEDGKPISFLGLNWDVTKDKLLAKELKDLNQTLEHFAYYDHLTGLMNRHSFADAVQRIIGQAKRHHYLLAVLFIDLDYFKQINDTLGHDIGDQVLVQTAKRLSQSLRPEDIICRQGGDEFIVVLNDIQSKEIATKIAAKIIVNLSQSYLILNEKIQIGVSIGMALYPEAGEAIADLLDKADKALLLAKKEGKGRYEIYTKESPKAN